MKRKGRKFDDRSKDLTCSWFTNKYGKDWEAWRVYADEWLHMQDSGLKQHIEAINWFFESYLAGRKLPTNPSAFFDYSGNYQDLINDIDSGSKSIHYRIALNNRIVDFINWIILKDYSTENDFGQQVPIVKNPFSKEKNKNSYNETVWTSLPYIYIKELRTILCPNPKGHFSDWIWAHKQTGQAGINGIIGKRGDWFEVEYRLIDKNDPDCVWRKRELLAGQYPTIKGKLKKIKKLSRYEMWSPVRAMALYIKLHLPLRTHQVRMLDSGEADTWFYIKGQWQRNTQHEFASGDEKRPYQRGVFRRIRSLDTGEWYTGLYINTNKTADQNKDAVDRGYVIPWQHEDVLYWLEKLRNWQKKYNPILNPTQWSSLESKHTGGKKSEQTLKQMGSSCFLFRDASAIDIKNRHKPISYVALYRTWYRLLKTLEDRVFDRGQTLKDGSRLRFVKKYDTNILDSHKKATEFPLHSLRVSLITCYALDGQVPLPVISKLLAGHSRLIMTLHYCKISPTVMHEKMQKAEVLIDYKETESLKSFLTDAEMEEIQYRTVYQDAESVSAILVNRNPLGWVQRHIGLCLAGGNTVRSDEKTTLAGCWNGGKLIKDGKAAINRIYGPVPHGPENCIRCRWFITDANYLNALIAHCNNFSYRAHLAANLASEIEQTVESLQDERYSSMEANKPFTKIAELHEAERRYEKQIVEADEYANDFIACFKLIHRIISIETKRSDDDNCQKLVAVGQLKDIYQPISLLESNSELFQLSGICEDAEIYSELSDELRKTPAIEKRSRALNSALIRDGYQPFFLSMDEKIQLIFGNAMIREMAKQACPEDWRVEGIRRVTGIVEAKQSLKEFGLLDIGIAALEKKWEQSMFSLNTLMDKPKLEIVYDQSRP